MMIIQQDARMGTVRIVTDCKYVYKSRYAGRVSICTGFCKLCMVQGDESLSLQVAETMPELAISIAIRLWPRTEYSSYNYRCRVLRV